MKNNKLLYYFFALIVVMGMTSCEDFLDINEDPNNPTEVPNQQLLPSIQVNVGGVFGESIGGLGSFASHYTMKTTERGNQSNFYQFNSAEFGVSTPWRLGYTFALQDIKEMERQAAATGETAYAGIGQVLRVVILSTFVDFYGDIPYTEANNAAEIQNPSFDDDAAVYEALVVELDQAIATLQNGGTVRGDLMYNGDLSKWIRLANTWKLKMYNNIRKVQDVSMEVNALIDANNMIGAGDDFQMNYGQNVTPSSRNPVYVQEWGPAASRIYINPYLFELMSGIDTYEHGNDILLGVQDPRIPYYYYNQLAAPDDALAENPCSYCPSRSGTPFLSIWPFSFDIDPNEGFDQGVSSTILGLYPAGGRYDDGAGVKADFNGTGDAPQRILTYYDHLFIRAELAQVGVTSENAGTLFESAMRASFDKVNELAADAGAPVIVQDDIDAYVSSVMERFNDSGDDRRLEHIMTQKWLATFGASVGSYTDYRRTGYPVLHDPETDNLDFTESLGLTFPRAYPWPQDELLTNPSAPAQKDIYTYRVFWDVQ